MRSRPSSLRPVGHHDLLADLGHPGCPVCRGAGRAAWRYVDALLWEFVNDPGVRGLLRSSHGLCREHAMLALDVARDQAAATGVAVLYEDFLRHVRDEATRALGEPRRWPRWTTGSPARVLQPHLGCPTCDSADRVAHSYLRILAASDGSSEVGAAARRPQRTICVPHLLQGLPLARDRNDACRLLEIYLKGEEELRNELGEFIRKQNHRFRDEPVPRGEANSWIRAVFLMVGSPLPRRRPER